MKENETNRNQIESNSQANTQYKDIRKPSTTTSTLNGKKLTPDDDEFNVIALPTEPVTENVPFPENILTTRTTFVTRSPSTTSVQVTESLTQDDDDNLNMVDIDTTTLVSDVNVITDNVQLSKQNTVASRPFSRPTYTRSRLASERGEVSVNTRATSTVHRSTRTRPPVSFTTEDPDELTSALYTYSYVPGYRGTARYRTKPTGSGQYDKDKDNLFLSNFQPIDDNRLRALNFERSERPASTEAPAPRETRPSKKTEEQASVKRTTEQPIIEANSHFRLDKSERPDKIRISLSTGRKIEFGATPAKSASKVSESDPLKIKVITGPLEKSPLVSGRDYRKGNVEEIPIFRRDESVTVSSFSKKLNLNQIPLNKSDIVSFVADENLRTNSPTEDNTTTRRVRPKPSIIGYVSRPQSGENSDADYTTATEGVLNEITTSRTRLQPFKSRVLKETQSQEKTTSGPVSDEKTSRFSFRPGHSRSTRPQKTQEQTSDSSNEAAEADSTTRRLRPSVLNSSPQRSNLRGKVSEITSVRSRPSGFTQREPTDQQSDDSNIEESTTSRVRPSGFSRRLSTRPVLSTANELSVDTSSTAGKSRLSLDTTTRSRFRVSESINDSSPKESTSTRTYVEPKSLFSKRPRDEDIEDVNDLQTESSIEDSTIRKSILRATQKGATTSNSIESEDEEDQKDLDFLEIITEQTVDDDNDNDDKENEIDLTTQSIGEHEKDETTVQPVIGEISTTVRYKKIIRVRPVKKNDALATRQTITEATKEQITTNGTDDEYLERTKDSKPTRRVVTRRRPVITSESSKDSKALEQSVASFERTTKPRIVVTQTRQRTSTAKDEDNDEITETTTEYEEQPLSPLTSPRTTRKRIIVTHRQRISTTESQEKNDEAGDSEVAKEQEASRVTLPRTTRKRIVVSRPVQRTTTAEAESINDDNEDDSNGRDNENLGAIPIQPPSRTTRKRIVFTRTRPVVDEQENVKGDGSTNVDESTSEKSSGILGRKQVKIYRPRLGSKKISDDSAVTSNPLMKTRVSKQPLPSDEEDEKTDDGESETNADEESLSARPRFNLGTRTRKVIKIKTPVESTDRGQLPEVEGSTTGINSGVTNKRTYKVLKTKTPKFLVDRPLTDNSSLIQTDDDNQHLYAEDQRYHKDEQTFDNESSRPIPKFPTRPNRVVTIRRPSELNLNSRTSTTYPAKFNKDGGPTRAKKVTVRRKYTPTSVSSSSTLVDEIEPEKKAALGERNKKIFAKGYSRKIFLPTNAPNITPLTDTETTAIDDVDDTTNIPLDNNDENILQRNASEKPSFSLRNFTTTTTVQPTTLHHVFAIPDDSSGKLNKTEIRENQADEVIKKLQKLIEINRIVEVYSKEEKLKLLKNKKLKSIAQSELTLDRPPSIDKFGEISRETIIKLVKPNVTETTTDVPLRSPKSVMFADTVFSQFEASTISLEGLFEREKKSYDDSKNVSLDDSPATRLGETVATSVPSLVRAPTPLLRPESNETNPIIISLKSLDKVILSKVHRAENDHDEDLTTESPSEDTTLIENNN